MLLDWDMSNQASLMRKPFLAEIINLCPLALVISIAEAVLYVLSSYPFGSVLPGDPILLKSQSAYRPQRPSLMVIPASSFDEYQGAIACPVSISHQSIQTRTNRREREKKNSAARSIHVCTNGPGPHRPRRMHPSHWLRQAAAGISRTALSQPRLHINHVRLNFMLSCYCSSVVSACH